MHTALVTGADRGLGRGFVENLLERGWWVFATIQPGHDAELQHENLTWIPLELESDESIKQAIALIQQQTTSLTLFINNAAVNKDTVTDGQPEKVSTLGMLDRESLLKMFNINTVAPLLLIQHALPLLTEDPSFVVNVSSCRASFHDEFEDEYGNYGYRASKVALNMCTARSLVDLPSNIKTVAVHPGDLKTEMNTDGEQDPCEQAAQILNIMDHWQEDWNGAFMRYDGNLYPL